MGHYRVRVKFRRRKVAKLASKSRAASVNNCTIPSVDENSLIDVKTSFGTIKAVKGTADFTIPEEGFKQTPKLRKKYKKKYYNKGSKDIRKVISHSSDYDQFDMKKYTPKKMNRVEYYEKLVEHKTKRWEKRHPCPVKTGTSEPDLFETQYLPEWKLAREKAIERFRDFVVSIYDKLPLSGRFKKSDNEYVEKGVAELKDVNGEGHKINDLDPKKSKLLKKAQDVTNKVHAKHANLIATNLKDHKRKHGRIILPKAA